MSRTWQSLWWVRLYTKWKGAMYSYILPAAPVWWEMLSCVCVRKKCQFWWTSSVNSSYSQYNYTVDWMTYHFWQTLAEHEKILRSGVSKWSRYHCTISIWQKDKTAFKNTCCIQCPTTNCTEGIRQVWPLLFGYWQWCSKNHQSSSPWVCALLSMWFGCCCWRFFHSCILTRVWSPWSVIFDLGFTLKMSTFIAMYCRVVNSVARSALAKDPLCCGSVLLPPASYHDFHEVATRKRLFLLCTAHPTFLLHVSNMRLPILTSLPFIC